MKPCRRCGKPFVKSQPREQICRSCRSRRKAVRFEPRPKPAYHKGDYPRRAKAVTDAAKANPLTQCWRCGRTLAQHPPHKTGRPATWHAGHVIDGDPNSPLLPEASTCNSRSGAQLGQRLSKAEPREWLRADYHSCPTCGATVKWASQRCCSRACSTQWRRANRPPKPKPTRPKTEKPCQLCGSMHDQRSRYCSDQCKREAHRRSMRDKYRANHGLAVNPNEPTKRWAGFSSTESAPAPAKPASL